MVAGGYAGNEWVRTLPRHYTPVLSCLSFMPDAARRIGPCKHSGLSGHLLLALLSGGISCRLIRVTEHLPLLPVAMVEAKGAVV